jgi:hypothetical protein
VKKILVAIMATIGGAAVALVCGIGTASAEDGVVGETYALAKQALRKQGKTPVVTSTVGDREDWNACLVVSATPAAVLDGFGKSKHKGRVNIALNCYADFATTLSPGFSLQSPEGQKLYQEALDAYRKKKAKEAQLALLEQMELSGAQ